MGAKQSTAAKGRLVVSNDGCEAKSSGTFVGQGRPDISAMGWARYNGRKRWLAVGRLHIEVYADRMTNLVDREDTSGGLVQLHRLYYSEIFSCRYRLPPSVDSYSPGDVSIFSISSLTNDLWYLSFENMESIKMAFELRKQIEDTQIDQLKNKILFHQAIRDSARYEQEKTKEPFVLRIEETNHNLTYPLFTLDNLLYEVEKNSRTVTKCDVDEILRGITYEEAELEELYITGYNYILHHVDDYIKNNALWKSTIKEIFRSQLTALDFDVWGQYNTQRIPSTDRPAEPTTPQPPALALGGIGLKLPLQSNQARRERSDSNCSETSTSSSYSSLSSNYDANTSLPGAAKVRKFDTFKWGACGSVKCYESVVELFTINEENTVDGSADSFTSFALSWEAGESPEECIFKYHDLVIYHHFNDEFFPTHIPVEFRFVVNSVTGNFLRFLSSSEGTKHSQYEIEARTLWNRLVQAWQGANSIEGENTTDSSFPVLGSKLPTGFCSARLTSTSPLSKTHDRAVAALQQCKNAPTSSFYRKYSEDRGMSNDISVWKINNATSHHDITIAGRTEGMKAAAVWHHCKMDIAIESPDAFGDSEVTHDCECIRLQLTCVDWEDVDPDLSFPHALRLRWQEAMTSLLSPQQEEAPIEE